MAKILAGWVTIFLLHNTALAADKIRIGFPELAGQFIPLPLAQKRGFLEEEGLQAEFIRMRTLLHGRR
jgi:hypothetical protein